VDLADARALALSFPGTHEEPHFDMTSFRCGTKVFATAPPDGGQLRIFVDETETMACVAEDPSVFSELWWGKRLSGVGVALGGVGPERLGELLEEAWRRKASKADIARFDAGK
jgi:hypothetical protein